MTPYVRSGGLFTEVFVERGEYGEILRPTGCLLGADDVAESRYTNVDIEDPEDDSSACEVGVPVGSVGTVGDIKWAEPGHKIEKAGHGPERRTVEDHRETLRAVRSDPEPGFELAESSGEAVEVGCGPSGDDVCVTCAGDGGAVQLRGCASHQYVLDSVTVENLGDPGNLLVAQGRILGGWRVRSSVRALDRRCAAGRLRHAGGRGHRIATDMLIAPLALRADWPTARAPVGREPAYWRGHRRRPSFALCSAAHRRRSPSGRVAAQSLSARAWSSGASRRIRNSNPAAMSNRYNVGSVGWRCPFS